MAGSSAWDSKSLANSVFESMKHDDPVFREIKTLLLSGRRAEAISLIRKHDTRLDDPDAKELLKMIMNTLTDTVINP